MPPAPASRLALGLPLVYFAFAGAALAAAFAIVAFAPRSVAGFYYHPRMLVVVHLVTLGWITASILGSLYMMGPLALQLPMRAGRVDAVAAALYMTGALGMVGHFYLEAYRGLPWAGAMLVAGLAVAAARVLRGLGRSRLPGAIRLHVALATVNFLAAATLGILLAIHKTHPLLPGHVLDSVAAHAHLAAVGWATLLAVGLSYRLLPMIFPAAVPRGAGPWSTALLLEGGVVGLVLALLRQSTLATRLSAILLAAGVAVYLAQVVAMLRHRLPAPVARPRPDFAALHVISACFCLALAAGLGLLVAWNEPSTWRLRAVLAYGALGLVGFLGQLIVGVKARMLPLFVWIAAYGGRLPVGPPPSPYRLAPRPLQGAVFVLWTAAFPALLLGLALDRVPWLAVGAAGLLLATLLDAAAVALAARHLVRRAS